MSAVERVLLIDHYDSFVHILADQFRRRGCAVDIRRSTWPPRQALSWISAHQPGLVVLSPGPGRPQDHPLSLQLLRDAGPAVPIFGVCLGHQCIVTAFGGQVGHAATVVHGRFSHCRHSGSGLFQDLPDPLQVGRYHSLIASHVPAELLVDARCAEEVMAVRHSQRPVWGVQFHPESILTPCGGLLIDNLLATLEHRHAA